MTRRAFTLIELMIVLAILSIVINSMWAPVQQMFRWLRVSENDFEAQRTATLAFQLVKEALRQTRQINCLNSEEITCEGGPVSMIRRAKGGAGLVFEKIGGRVHVEFPEGFRFGPFQAVSRQTFWCPVFLGIFKLPMFWRCSS